VEIRYYGQKESNYNLYDDDWVSFDYEKGKFTRIVLSVTKDKKGILKGNVNIPKGNKVWSYSSFTWKFMSN
jgi:alpha-D-xyloside xylohydrolase